MFESQYPDKRVTKSRKTDSHPFYQRPSSLIFINASHHLRKKRETLPGQALPRDGRPGSTRPARPRRGGEWSGRAAELLGVGWPVGTGYSGGCSKSFGESTPNREAYRAHSSPNSPISPRLVKLPPLEGPARHIVHQTFWNNSIPCPQTTLFRTLCDTPDLVLPLSGAPGSHKVVNAFRCTPASAKASMLPGSHPGAHTGP